MAQKISSIGIEQKNLAGSVNVRRKPGCPSCLLVLVTDGKL